MNKNISNLFYVIRNDTLSLACPYEQVCKEVTKNTYNFHEMYILSSGLENISLKMRFGSVSLF